MRRADARALALVLDFDGTIVERDIGDEIVDRFGAPGWRDLDRAWAAGELTLVEMQRRVWPEVRASREAVAALLEEKARFRPGFEALVGRAAAAGVRVVVASGGFDFYIAPVLARLGGDAAARIEVIANSGRFAGERIEVDFPHGGQGCGSCGVCKGAVVERIRSEGFEPAFCGDGGSDRCAAGAAARLFAVEGSRLARHCEAEGVAYEAFRTFDEVGRALGI